MPQHTRDDDQDELEFNVTDLHPPCSRPNISQRLRLDARQWRWVAVGLSLVLALAVVLSSVPATHNSLARLVASAFSTATPNSQIIVRQIIIDDSEPTPFPT